MNRASPLGGVFAASNRPSPIGSIGSNRASPIGGLLTGSPSLHLAKPSILPASRPAFPARPGNRAGRRKIPFVAASGVVGADPSSQQLEGGDKAVPESSSSDMALDRFEPDAALELVRNWNQCLENFYQCFGESDSEEEEEEFRGFTQAEAFESQASAEKSYQRRLADVIEAIDELRREDDDESGTEIAGTQETVGPPTKEDREEAHYSDSLSLGDKTPQQTPQQTPHQTPQQAPHQTPQQTPQLTPEVKVRPRGRPPKSASAAGKKRLTDLPASSSAEGAISKRRCSGTRGKADVATTEELSSATSEASSRVAQPAESTLQSSSSEAGVVNGAPCSVPTTPLILRGKRERKPSMKIKMLAAEKSAAASPLVRKFAEELGGGVGGVGDDGVDTASLPSSRAGSKPGDGSEASNAQSKRNDSDRESAETTNESAKPNSGVKLPLVAVAELRKTYASNEFPDAATRFELAKRLKILPSQIKYWFQRERKNRKRRGDVGGSGDAGGFGDAGDLYEDSTVSTRASLTPVRDSTSEYDIDDDDDLEGSRPLKIDLDALPEYEGGFVGAGDSAGATPTRDLSVDVQSPTKIRIKSPRSTFPRFQSSHSHQNLNSNRVLSSSSPHLSSSASVSSPSSSKKRPRHEFSKSVLINLWTKLILFKDDPFPTLAEKQKIATENGLKLKQVTKWFFSARDRKYLLLKNSLEGLEDFIDQKYGFGKSSTPLSVSNSNGLREEEPVSVDASNLPPEATNVLMTWLLYHPNNPFPTLEEMHTISRRAGVSVNAIRLWFEARNKKSTSKSSDELHWSDVDGYDLGRDDDGDDLEDEASQPIDHLTSAGDVISSPRLTPTSKENSSNPPKERLTLKTTQADVLRTWLYRNKANPTLQSADVDELVENTKLSKEEIHRWMTFALKKRVQERLVTVWRKKGEKVIQDERGYFPPKITNILKRFLLNNPSVGLPTAEDYLKLWKKTGLTMKQIRSWYKAAKRRNLREKLIRDRTMLGRSFFEWEREADPPTDDEEKMELVVEIPIKKRGSSLSGSQLPSKSATAISSPSDSSIVSICLPDSVSSLPSVFSSISPAALHHLHLTLFRRRRAPTLDAKEKQRLVRLTRLTSIQVARWFHIARTKRWNRKLIVTYKDGTVFDVASELEGFSSDPITTSSSNGNSRPVEKNEAVEKTSALLPALRTAVAKLTPQTPDPSEDDDDDADDLLRQDLNLSSSTASSSNGSLNAKDLEALRNRTFESTPNYRTDEDLVDVEREEEEEGEEEEEESYEVFEDSLGNHEDHSEINPSKHFLLSIVPNPTQELTESQHQKLSFLLFTHRLDTSPSPSATELTDVCRATSLEEDFVLNWFQDRVGEGIHRLLEERWRVAGGVAIGGSLPQGRHQRSSEANGEEASAGINSSGRETVTSRSRRVIKPAKRFIEEHETMVKKTPHSLNVTTSTAPTQRKRESTPSGLEPNPVSEAAITPATTKNKANNNNTIGYGNRKFVAMTLAQIKSRVDKLPNVLRVMFSFRQHDLLCEWLHDNQDHPFPTEADRQLLSQSTSLSRSQVANWLTNARRRILIASGAAREGGLAVDGRNVVVASGDEGEGGASLYAAEPTKNRCDVCHSQLKLLGYASATGSETTVCEACKIFYQTSLSRGSSFECRRQGACGRGGGSEGWILGGENLLDCDACRLAVCQRVFRPQVRPPPLDAGVVSKVFTNGGNGVVEALSPGGTRDDTDSTPQRKGPRIKYVCRKAAVAQGQGAPAIFSPRPLTPPPPLIPPHINEDEAESLKTAPIRKGPRIKHVCRKAAVALGQGKPALFGHAGSLLSPRRNPDDLIDEEVRINEDSPLSPSGLGKGSHVHLQRLGFDSADGNVPSRSRHDSHSSSWDSPYSDRTLDTPHLPPFATKTTPQDGRSREFRLSALPAEEKEKIYEAEKYVIPDPDDLPVEELIERAEAIATGTIVEQGSEKYDRGAGKGLGGKGKGVGAGGGKGAGIRYSGGGGKASGGKGAGLGKGIGAGNQKSDKGRRKIRCRECKGCLAEDCDVCVYCVDKTKNGGPNTIRQACIRRRCLNPHFSNTVP